MTVHRGNRLGLSLYEEELAGRHGAIRFADRPGSVDVDGVVAGRHGLAGIRLEDELDDVGDPVRACSQVVLLFVESLEIGSPLEKEGENAEPDPTLSTRASMSSPLGRSPTLRYTKIVPGGSSKRPVSGSG